MVENRKNNRCGVSKLDHEEEEKIQNKTLERRFSSNETPVPLLDPKLKRWIKVIRPSRASLTYERME